MERLVLNVISVVLVCLGISWNVWEDGALDQWILPGRLFESIFLGLLLGLRSRRPFVLLLWTIWILRKRERILRLPNLCKLRKGPYIGLKGAS